MPVRRLPSNPNLDHLKYQARDLLEDHATCAQGAAQRIREFHPRFGGATDSEIFGARLSLSDAQLAIAREYGFPSWTRLQRHIERPTLSDQLDLPHHQRIEDDVFRRAVDLLDAGEVSGLREHLKKHPHLAKQRVVFEAATTFGIPRYSNSWRKTQFATGLCLQTSLRSLGLFSKLVQASLRGMGR